ncbi:MAG: hypothetical protein ABFE01_14100 [Phycisphaerales bacterium]
MNARHSVSVTMTPLLAASLQAGTATITTDAGQKGPAINPRMCGTVLTSANLADNNNLDEPRRVAPVETWIDTAAKEFPHEFPPRSLTILRIATQ